MRHTDNASLHTPKPRSNKIVQRTQRDNLEPTKILDRSEIEIEKTKKQEYIDPRAVPLNR